MIEWREVPGYPGYMVSNDGQVKGVDRTEKSKGNGVRFRRGKTIRPSKNRDGYLRCQLFRDGVVHYYCIHRIVAMTFIGLPPNGYAVHHINGDRLDNRASNLEYMEVGEHSSHHIVSGKGYIARGETLPHSKLSEEQAREIKHLLRNGNITQRDIAKHYGVRFQTINNIHRGKSWAWVD